MMKLNFKEFFKLCENQDAPLGTVIPNSPFGAVPSAEGKPNSGDPAPIRPTRGDFNLGLPEVNIVGKITSITGPGQQVPGQLETHPDKRNIHIFIATADGKTQELIMPYSRFKAVQGDPKINSTVSVSLQRRADDTSRLPSQVNSIMVH